MLLFLHAVNPFNVSTLNVALVSPAVVIFSGLGANDLRLVAFTASNGFVVRYLSSPFIASGA